MRTLDQVMTVVAKGDDGCWDWLRYHDRDGYARMQWADRPGCLAHRVIYELLVVAIPDGLELDHLCRNRGCVNPDHLEPVTRAVNVARGVGPTAVNGRRMRCVNGHLFDEGNTYRRKDGTRQCRACNLERVRRYQARVRSAA